MRELSPETITDAVLDQMATTADPRLKEIMASAVKHLHAFAGTSNLTLVNGSRDRIHDHGRQDLTPARQSHSAFRIPLGSRARQRPAHKTAIEEGTHTSLLGPFYREASPTWRRQPDRQACEAGKPSASSTAASPISLASRCRATGLGLADQRRWPL